MVNQEISKIVRKLEKEHGVMFQVYNMDGIDNIYITESNEQDVEYFKRMNLGHWDRLSLKFIEDLLNGGIKQFIDNQEENAPTTQIFVSLGILESKNMFDYRIKSMIINKIATESKYRFEEYKRNYSIENIDKEFFMRKYCELQVQYENTNEKDIDNRLKLMNMIIDMSDKCNFKYKEPCYDYSTLIIVEDTRQMINLRKFIENIVGSERIEYKDSFANSNSARITLSNGITIKIILKTYQVISDRFDNYLNLTNYDKKYEEEILQPCLINGK